ncbi:MAG: peptidoglycan DD-metalloendopeptidase family protein [Desulfobacter sp.]
MLPFLKTDFKIGPAVFAGCLFLLLGLIVVRDLDAAVLYKGTANAYKLNIRSGPSQRSKVVVTIEKGDVVDVLEVKGGIGGWLTVTYKDKKGYVRNRPKYITLAPLPSQRLEDKTAATPPEKKPAVKPKPAIHLENRRAGRKKALDREIVAEAQKVASFSQKETEIMDGLNEIDYALNQARVKAEELNRKSKVLTSEIKRIREETRVLGQSMDETRDYAAQRLNALYRMHMMGSLEMTGPPASLFDFFVKQNAMKKVVASDFALLETKARDLKDLDRLEKDLEQQKDTQAAIEGELALQIRIQEKESGKKTAILEEVRRKKELSEAALASLQESARHLDKTLNAMGLKGSAVLDDTSFVKHKGRLSLPVKGRIISTFGTARKGDYKSFTFQSGIDIRVERGEPVRSVFKGEVMFAQWLKGYGNLVIINHGDNYYTLYAHVEEMFKKKGEAVGTGEVIATAGDTGSMKGLRLHFEVRHHGKPVNPMKWLKKGT